MNPTLKCVKKCHVNSVHPVSSRQYKMVPWVLTRSAATITIAQHTILVRINSFINRSTQTASISWMGIVDCIGDINVVYTTLWDTWNRLLHCSTWTEIHSFRYSVWKMETPTTYPLGTMVTKHLVPDSATHPSFHHLPLPSFYLYHRTNPVPIDAIVWMAMDGSPQSLWTST